MFGVTPKYILRSRIILTSAASRLLSSFSTVAISLVVVRLESALLWGDVIYFILLLDLGFVIVAWGQNSFFNQEFSLHPDKIAESWFTGFAARGLLLFCLLIAVLFSPLSTDLKTILLTIAIGRFVYQSFEPINQFERYYTFTVLAELSGLAIILIPIVTDRIQLNAKNILFLFALSFLFKGFVSVIYHYKLVFVKREWLSAQKIRQFFFQATPFFLLSISGMLQQRIDLYCVAYFTEPATTGQYQVFLNLLLISHLGASLLLSPFAKNIFRLPDEAAQRLQQQFIRAGVVISIICIGMIFTVITFFYRFELPATMYIIGYFYILAFYVYLLKNYEFGKKQKQSLAALFSFIGCAVNLVASILLTPYLGMEGALLAGLITQITIIILYFSKAHQHKIV
jgi:O-antigen/teichoic acid export membrane protein